MREEMDASDAASRPVAKASPVVWRVAMGLLLAGSSPVSCVSGFGGVAMTRIGVIGAGITGVTAAYALCERGYDVTVFDQHRYAAMETSFANGGQLSASNAEVWNKMSTVWQGTQWMMRRDAPLLMNPTPGWHKYSWMTEFCSNIPNHRKNTLETVRLAIESRRHMFAMAERENIDFDLKRCGILHFYRDKASFDKAAKANALLIEGGLERRPVTPEEIRQIEPTLKGSYYGGFFTPSDSTGDIHKFTRGLADACARRGVRFVYDAQVEKIVPKDGGFEVRWLPVAPDDTKAAMDRLASDPGRWNRDLRRDARAAASRPCSATGSTSTRSRATRSRSTSTRRKPRPPPRP